MTGMYNAKSQAQGLNTQAQADIYSGQQQATAGMWGAGATILNGASSLAAKYA
jgi:hypothetical protein